MSIQNNFSILRPSLLLDFANTRQLDPRITFTRASTATFYDGRTVAKAEENLFINSVWAGAASGTPGTFPTNWTVLGSNGSLTVAGAAITFFAAAGSRHFMGQTINVTAGTTIQVSVDIDAVSGTSTEIVVLAVAGTATFTGTPSVTVAAGTGRKTLSLVITGTGTLTLRFGAGVSQNVVTDCSVTMQQPQVEVRSSATAYTATTTAPITNYIPALQTAAAGVPRFEHNPVTGESLGLEIEEQRTNLLTYSDQFNDAGWVKSRSSITANIIVAPDGTLTGDRLVEDTTASNTHDMNRTATVAASTVVTASIYAKAGERTEFALRCADPAFIGRAFFNLATGALGARDAGVTASSITPVGNGWFRCTATYTTGASGTTANVQPQMSVGGAPGYTGDGYSGMYFWGAQLEAGAFPTSYIPTVATQVTRSADAATMTGTNFSSWYRANEGTLYADYVSGSSQTAQAVFTLNDSSDSNRIILFNDTASAAFATPSFVVSVAGVTQCTTTHSNSAPNATHKFSGAYAVNDFAATFDASTISADNAGNLPTNLTQANIGNNFFGNQPLNGTLRKIAYYPARLTNAQLQALTGS